MPTFTQTFGGTNIYPSDVSYRYVSLTIDQVLDWPLETAPSNDVVASIMDVNATTTSLVITMPDARDASTGETVLFNNVGSNTFTVKTSTGVVICAPQSGTTFQIYLTDNSTASVHGVLSSTELDVGNKCRCVGWAWHQSNFNNAKSIYACQHVQH